MKPVVVIGSGFGGLAAAIRLRVMGYPVVVIEANEQIGGRASVFEKDGFKFDAGPTVVTAPYLLDELFQIAGRNSKDYFELMPVDPFYRVEYSDGSRFDYVGDEERIVQQIRQMSPGDADGYLKLARHAERIFDVGYTQLADQPFDQLSEMFRVLPQMVKLQNYKTVYGLVSQYVKDERLRQAFSFQPLLVGGNPFQTTSIYLLIHWLERKWGVHFPRGGTSAIVRALGKLLAELGVEILLNSPVQRIGTDGGSVSHVELSGGRKIVTDMVVSNADPMTVYKTLVDSKVRSKHSDFRLGLRRSSMSLFVAYFGTRKKYDQVAHHTILMGPRYQGLLKDIFDKRVLADDFSLYLHRPTASDPGLAPEGCDGFYVLSPVPNQLSGVDWETEGPRYQQKIYQALDERILPGFREHLGPSFFITPQYFETRLRSADGAAFGLEPVFRQSAYFRFHNRSEDVPGLYFVGASTHPGAGLPGVLCSAKVLEKIVAKPERPVPLPTGGGYKLRLEDQNLNEVILGG
ncbi:MAG: phytoene desaturase [Bdellovibrionales bacterium]|nr:phytoene desaturase [Bdellovibrionales bacterium]